MVYVTQDRYDINLLPARRFGDVQVILPANFNQGLLASAGMVKALSDALHKFSDTDYLILIGDPVAMGTASAIAAKANSGRVAFLKWDRQEQEYYPVQVTV